MGIDGVVFDVPDSAANAAAFGRPSAGPRGEGAFPQVRKLSLVELGTHVEVAFVARPITHGERAMVGPLLGQLDDEVLLLWDRGFFSYDLWKEVSSRRVKILARVTCRLILEPIRDLADGSYLAKIYPTPEDRRMDRDGIVVRVIRYTLDDPQRVGHGEVHTLIVDDDVTEMITFFFVTGALVYVDPEGRATGYEDAFTKLDAARAHYAATGLGAEAADRLVR